MDPELTIHPAPGKQFELRARQWVPATLDEIFAFFSEATNLEMLTPAFLNFRLLTPTPIEMREGLLIDYRITLRGLSLRWRSEITSWEPPHRFIDEQRRGPYRVWRHEHTFTEHDGGVLLTDHVVYGVVGDALVNRLFVEPDVRKIFAFRQRRMAELFPEGSDPTRRVSPGSGDRSASKRG